jgi:hypothetical protein
MQRGHHPRNYVILSANSFAKVRFEMAKVFKSLG